MLKLHPLFTSHMVFAAHKPIRIFGTGSGTAVVSFAGKTLEAVSCSSPETLSENGPESLSHCSSDTCPNTSAWLVDFPPMPYGGPYELTVSQEGQTITLNDIYVGEVYLLAGQSNLQFKLHESSTPPELWHSNEMLRLFSTRRLEEGDRFTPEDGWLPCKKEDAGDWSALGYLTGDLITERKGVAVGLITCYQGASVIESWVPAGTFQKAGITLSDEEKFFDHFTPEYQIWNADGTLYEHALGQILPFSVSAVIWYQGESDCSIPEGKVYARELCLLIDAWRAAFSDDALPFAVIQIANNLEPRRSGWKLIQQAQLEAQAMRPSVATVISADVCEDFEIHPRTKDKLAARIAETLIQLTAQ